jgi:hypothetical protein
MKRPRSVTILSILVLTQSALYLTRLLLTIVDWDFWQAQFLPGTAPYLVVTAALWGPVLLLIGLGLWRGARRARTLLRYLAPVYLAYAWVEQLALGLVNNGGQAWPFWLVTSLLLLFWLYWILSRPQVKNFFGDRLHERQPQNS